MKFAYFPGCSLESTGRAFDRSTRAFCSGVGIELTEIPDWICCGSTPAHGTSPVLAVALPALNLTKARAMGLPVLTACASCYNRLRTASHGIENDRAERERVERVLARPWDGAVEVFHLLDVLLNRLGPEEIRRRVRTPLGGLKVACYYGCLLTRPPEIAAFEDPEHPGAMDALLRAAGAEPVEWPFRTECCGAGLSVTEPKASGRLCRRLIEMARDAGAACVAVVCPLCQTNLELRQEGEMPVHFVTELLCRAMGIYSAGHMN